jgi:hypothetical protein
LDKYQLGVLPTHFDWRNYNGADWTTKAKHQGFNCNSCWAFAAIGALEAMVNIVEGNPDLDLDLSEQHLLSCSTQGWGCKQGSNANTAFKFLKDTAGGAIPETCFPFDPNFKPDPDDNPCSSKCSDWTYRCVPITDCHPNWGPSIDFIKNLIVNHGPIVSDMIVRFDDFPYFPTSSWDSEGVYTWNGIIDPNDGIHQVVIVGYKDTPNNQNYGGYWICKNSYGANWGPWGNGFFGIAYKEVDIGDFITRVEYSSSAPETTINDGPSGTIFTDTVQFKWTGLDDITPTPDLMYSYMLYPYETSWTPWMADTEKTYNNLPEGDYSFKVKSRDGAYIPDNTPEERIFKIDNQLEYSPKEYDFGDKQPGWADSISFNIWSVDTQSKQPICYELSVDCEWVEVSPAKGCSKGEKDTINVNINTAGLPYGLNKCSIMISSTKNNVPVQYFDISINIVDDKLDQEQTSFDKNLNIFGDNWLAQSFIPSESELTRIKLFLSRIGVPIGNLILTIHDSLSGPALYAVAKSSMEIPYLRNNWVEFNFDDLYLTPGDTYYIILHAVGESSSRSCYQWGVSYHRSGFFITPYGGLYMRNVFFGWYQTFYDGCYKTYVSNY